MREQFELLKSERAETIIKLHEEQKFKKGMQTLYPLARNQQTYAANILPPSDKLYSILEWAEFNGITLTDRQYRQLRLRVSQKYRSDVGEPDYLTTKSGALVQAYQMVYFPLILDAYLSLEVE